MKVVYFQFKFVLSYFEQISKYKLPQLSSTKISIMNSTIFAINIKQSSKLLLLEPGWIRRKQDAIVK